MTANTSTSLVDQAFPEQWPIGPSPFLRGRDQLVDRLLYGVFHHRRTQLLSGPDGAGKTIALQRLQRRLRGRRTLVTLDGGEIEGQQGLLVSLCNALDQQPRPAKAIVSACLQARLKALADQGLAVVLLIDDGDTLSSEALDTICDWTRADGEHGRYPLTVVISCRPSLSERLVADPRYWQDLPLKPLSLLGTGRYLQQRLDHAGIRTPGPFDRAHTKAILQQSGGWPGAIDALARDRLLQEPRTVQRRRMRRPPGERGQPPRRNLSGLLLLLLLALLAWWYRAPLLEKPLWENRDRVVEQLQTLGQTLVEHWLDQTPSATGPDTSHVSSSAAATGDNAQQDDTQPSVESGYNARSKASQD